MRKLMAAFGLGAALALGAGAAEAQDKELFLYNWSNYFPPDLLQKFEKDTGVKVTLDVYDSTRHSWPSCKPARPVTTSWCPPITWSRS